MPSRRVDWYLYQLDRLGRFVRRVLGIERKVVPPFRCRYCGLPTWVDPSDQYPPPDYCHEIDHGYEEGPIDE